MITTGREVTEMVAGLHCTMLSVTSVVRIVRFLLDQVEINQCIAVSVLRPRVEMKEEIADQAKEVLMTGHVLVGVEIQVDLGKVEIREVLIFHS